MLKTERTFHFTAEGIKALKPEAKRVDYWDATVSGFGLRVTPKGVKTWFYWYRTGLVKRRWTIGRSPQMSLADAREKARASYGKDPAREKVEGRHAQTFGDLAEAYLRLHAKPNKRSWKRDELCIERNLDAWKNIPAKDITRKAVQALLDEIADPGGRNAPASARAVKLLLSKMFTLRVHRKAFEAAAAAPAAVGAPAGRSGASLAQLKLLTSAPDADDERAEASEEDVTAQDEAVMEAATTRTMGEASADVYRKERDLLARMTEVADAARGLPDSRVRHLVDWSKKHGRRVLVFTEYSDTKRYLEKQLRAALTPGREADPLIATYHGGMTEEAREEVKRAFNADPEKHPLRVLIATDAAREGVNLQNHCADLFHFDVPWNPSRIEQRNGRIDRKLQRAEEVRCHYFVYEQRPEDRVLKALVEKTKTIRRQLGSLAPVLERRLEDRLSAGFARRDADALAKAISSEEIEADRQKAAEAELESSRKREGELKSEIVQLQDLLEKSREWLRLDEGDLRQAISCGLELLGAKPLEPSGKDGEFVLPDLLSRAHTDPSWMHTLDTLRAPRPRKQPVWEWRKQQPIRHVVFADQGSLNATDVHLHLEHRFVQRLLGRFRSQGFVHQDLTRACVALTKDPVPRVVLLGRLSLYGERASRLHDQVLAVAGRWTDSSIRSEPLKPYADATLDKTLQLLEQALSADDTVGVPTAVWQRLGSGAPRDLDELRPHLKAQADELIARATGELLARGDKEAAEMRAILEAQRLRIQKTAVEKEKDLAQPGLFDQDERKQIESDKRHWQKRLDELARELDSEPARIRRSYDVKTARFEPVGLIYLWPITG